MHILGYILIGLGSGLLSGLFGVGGGVIIVPALSFAFTLQGISSLNSMHLVIGTTLGAMILTSAMSTWSHHNNKTVQWSLLKSLLPGTILGSFIGVYIGKHLTTHSLRDAFALIAAFVGIRLLFYRPETVIRKPIHVPVSVLFLFGVGAGVLSSLLGIGGGILLIPFLLWIGLTMPQISATSSACIFPTAILATIMNVIVGFHEAALPEHTWGFVCWPVALIIGLASLISAPLGVYLAYRLPVVILKRLFGGILLVIAWQMLPNRW